MIDIDISGAIPFVNENRISEKEAEAAYSVLTSGAYSDRTGWMDLPYEYNESFAGAVKAAADEIRKSSQVLVVIGIGGSFLGGRAMLELLRSPYYNMLPKNTPDIYFAGTSLSGEETEQLLMLIGGRDFSVNVISKSGSTIETSSAFRVFYSLLQSKYGEKAKSRIYVTTDPEKGILRSFASSEGCTSFAIPQNIGGRYSVLTPVGLLPAAVAGIDIDAVMSGALEEKRNGLDTALKYAAIRQSLYRSGFKVELLSCFEPCFRQTGEWWKQLFGESEGKNGLGIFPAYSGFTTDLHSLGQYIQDGERIIMETLVSLTGKSRSELVIPSVNPLCDNISPIAGKPFDFVNSAALPAVKKAHIDGGTPVTEIRIPSFTPESFGAMVYFFEMSCAVSACIMNVNPFNQPGVEAYKKNLFVSLGI